MKKFIFVLSISVFIVVLSASAFAGGGKVRGDNGTGEVNQEQEMDPPPFQTPPFTTIPGDDKQFHTKLKLITAANQSDSSLKPGSDTDFSLIPNAVIPVLYLNFSQKSTDFNHLRKHF